MHVRSSRSPIRLRYLTFSLSFVIAGPTVQVYVVGTGVLQTTSSTLMAASVNSHHMGVFYLEW